MVEEPAEGHRSEGRTFRLPDGGPERSANAQPLVAVELDAASRRSTGSVELDRVLGGGLVPGSLILLGGAPGIGKSTLLLQTAQAVATREGRVLYVSGEESLAQLKDRAQRLGPTPEGLEAVTETAIDRIVSLAGGAEGERALLIVDSIQAMFDPDLSSAPGSVAQVRECAARLMYLAKSNQLTVLMVGHTTKEGGLAGPRVLEHLVDVVLELEASPGHEHRLLRSRKNRFGSTRELGVFEMTSAGMQPVSHPSELFLADRAPPSPGAVVTATLEGSRPLLVEVQALVATTPHGPPRRATSGFDGGRLALLLAVLERRAGVDLLGLDIFINVTGGFDIQEPAADLAVAMALVSSLRDRPIPRDQIVFGEVGLGGEIRAVAQPAARCAEAARLGFGSAVIPSAGRPPKEPLGLDARRVQRLADAIDEI